MDSSSGNSTGSTQIHASGSDDASILVDLRKRKRLQSNREAAKRSRQRKQQHLEDLTAQAGRLRKENDDLIAGINMTNQEYLSVEAENAVLRAQMVELSQRLESVDGIVGNMNAGGCDYRGGGDGGGLAEPWMNSLRFTQPIMASPDAFQCWLDHQRCW